MHSNFTITGVTVADGPALAANNIPSFWAGPHWRLEWRHRTLECHISQVALRFPRNLLRNRETTRHEKAIDKITGKIVGYARWSMPISHSTITSTDDKSLPAWPEALVPAVSQEEEAEINRMAETTAWGPDYTTDPLIRKMQQVEDLILNHTEKSYMTLEYLAVHPDQQRQGIAPGLVRGGMQQAGKLGLDIFVHAMRPAVPVYQRLGSKQVGELIQDDTAYGGQGQREDYFLIYEQPTQTNS
ncbi:hypothetical protein OQA88_8016 [Cercophora sp. LCS_1]